MLNCYGINPARVNSLVNYAKSRGWLKEDFSFSKGSEESKHDKSLSDVTRQSKASGQSPANMKLMELANVVKSSGYTKRDVKWLLHVYINLKYYEDAIRLLFNFKNTRNCLDTDKPKVDDLIKAIIERARSPEQKISHDFDGLFDR